MVWGARDARRSPDSSRHNANPAGSLNAEVPLVPPGRPPLKQVGAVLGRVPNAQDRHHVRAGDPVDNEVGRHDHQLSRASLTPGSTTTGKYHQAVAGE
jgi:hypothetical protein